MTSSRSCSGSARTLAAALAAATALGCAGARPPAPPPLGTASPRILMLPLDDLAGHDVPLARLGAETIAALRRRGLDLVPPDDAEAFLRRHRIRSAAGVDLRTARLARDELGASAVLVTSVETWAARPWPRLAAAMRLVRTGDSPEVLWSDGAAAAGDERPGLLGLGLVRSADVVDRRVLDRLAGSLSAWLAGRGPRAPRCEADGRYAPRISYRAPQLEPGRHYTVAVLPFRNETDRPHAGELVALEFVRQLHALDRFTVVEPGEVRDDLLQYRLIMEGGVSISYAMTLLRTLRADLVVVGTVFDYRDDGGVPRVDFTALALDRSTERIAWQASSRGAGDDGVWLWDAGAVKTAGDLSCRLVRRAADQLATAAGRRPVPPETRDGVAP